jgi:hypothetical protein
MCVCVSAYAFNVHNTLLDLLLQQIALVVFVFFGSEGDEERKIVEKKRGTREPMNTVAIFETDVFRITLLFLFRIAPAEQIGPTSKIIHSLYIHMYILFYTHTHTHIYIYVCVCINIAILA